jgi:hypothetical protein
MDDSADYERGGGMRMSIATLLTQVSPFASLRAVHAGLFNFTEYCDPPWKVRP